MTNSARPINGNKFGLGAPGPVDQETVTAPTPLGDRIASRFPFHLIALGVLLYATGPVLARSSDTTGVLLSFWRLWFGVSVLAVGLAVHWASGRDIGTAKGFRLAVLAGATFSLNQVFFFTAIKRTTVVDASLMSTLAPVVVALVAIPLFGERPARPFRAWSALAMVGTIVVVLGSASSPDGDIVGMLMAVVSTVFFALFFVISKVSRPHIPVVSFLTAVMGTAAVFVSGFVFVLGLHPREVEGPDLWIALAMAIVPGTLGHIVMTWPLNYVPANVPPLMRLAGPGLSGTMAWVALDEGITLVQVVGGAVILFGLSGAVRSRAGQELVAEARAKVS